MTNIYTLFLFFVLTSFPTKVYSRDNNNGREAPTWTPSAGPPPTRIIATIPGWNIHKTPQGTYKFPDTVTIHSALKYSENNITSLNLRVALLGCSEWPDRWSLPFDQAGGDKYQPLKHLCLEDYSFSDNEFDSVRPPKGTPGLDSYLYQWQSWIWSGHARKWWQWRQLPSTQRSKTNAELWADAMDWSVLEKLELRDISGALFMRHISPKLTDRLTELTLDNFRPGENETATTTATWIASLPPLKKLTCLNSCTTNDQTLDLLLDKHGRTLETLRIHPTGMMMATTTDEPESGNPNITPSQIHKMATQAPNLTHLSIALERNGTWPLEALSAFSSQFPNLATLEIWLQYISQQGFMAGSDDPYYTPRSYEILQDEEDDTSELFQKPPLNKSNVTYLWEFMRDENEKSYPGSKLKSVRFRAGDFTRGWDGPLYFPDWYEGLRKSWVCGHDAVDGKDGCREDYGGESDIFGIQNEVDYEQQRILDDFMSF